MLQHVSGSEVSLISRRMGDELFEILEGCDGNQFYLMNGLKNPIITLQAQRWVRWRILHTSTLQDITVGIEGKTVAKRREKDGTSVLVTVMDCERVLQDAK